MFGSIVGDILGSIHENIPNLPLRNHYQMTDDSFLTLACAEWINDIDYPKFKFLFDSENSVQKNHFINDLMIQAEQFLIKWHEIGTSSNNQHKSIPIFSPGFDAWVLSKKNKIPSQTKHKGTTNGCLMRNSPIAFLGVKNDLSLGEILFLTEIFCKTTHPSKEAIEATRIHSSLLYYAIKKNITPYNLKKALTTDSHSLLSLNPPLKISDISIKPLDQWQPTEKVKFIWDAKNSLDIAASALYYSNSFQEAMDFCNNTKMDTDTYCAIAGSIAEQLWGIDEANFELAKSAIANEPLAFFLLEKIGVF